MLRRSIWLRLLKDSFPGADHRTLVRLDRKIAILYTVHSYLVCTRQGRTEECKPIKCRLDRYMKHFDKSDFVGLEI